MKDCRPDIFYQIGPTPEGTELPRCTSDIKCQELVKAYPEEHKPHMPQGPDAKWRFFSQDWR